MISLFLSPLCDEIICGWVSRLPCDGDNPVVTQSIVRWNPLLPRIPSVVRLRYTRRCQVHRAIKPSVAPYPVSRAIAIIPSLPNPSCDETLFCPISRQPCDCDNPIVAQSILRWNPLFAPYPVSRAIAIIPSLPNPSCDETLFCPVSRQPCDGDNPIVAQSILRWNPLLPHIPSAVRWRWSSECLSCLVSLDAADCVTAVVCRPSYECPQSISIRTIWTVYVESLQTAVFVGIFRASTDNWCCSAVDRSLLWKFKAKYIVWHSKSRNKASSREAGLNIRTRASSKSDRTRGVSVPCRHAKTVIDFLLKPTFSNTVRLSK